MLPENYNYKPINPPLRLKKSKIEGLGLFTTRSISQDTNLGLSHIVRTNLFEVVRTPIGGFVNHSENPNITFKNINGNDWYIFTLRDIKRNEELTADYSKEILFINYIMFYNK
jgi:SET domain-containing protein